MRFLASKNFKCLHYFFENFTEEFEVNNEELWKTEDAVVDDLRVSNFASTPTES